VHLITVRETIAIRAEVKLFAGLAIAGVTHVAHASVCGRASLQLIHFALSVAIAATINLSRVGRLAQHSARVLGLAVHTIVG
jgi:hypothetical protein